jgi:hypothetical protein
LDVFQWFGGRTSAEIILPDAINRRLLCPFQYFGVSDAVDLDSLTWQRGGYRVEDLDNLYTGNDVRGYAVDCNVLNALELGVPQDRERLFVIGVNKTIAKRAAERDLGVHEEGWFPWPMIGEYMGAKSLSWPTTIPFGETPSKPKEIPLELTVYPALFGKSDPEKMPNGCEFFNPYSSRFATIAEGDVARKSFKRLHRYRFSPTAWYGHQEVHLHPSKARRLSVREALRIQSVPDEYVLPEDMSLSAKFKMVCNGVPCVMMYSLGRNVFPVDSNCWRICRRLGWVRATRPDRSCSPRDMDRVQAAIPANFRFSLHVNLVSHGRSCCLPSTPHCESCCIQHFCGTGRRKIASRRTH